MEPVTAVSCIGGKESCAVVFIGLSTEKCLERVFTTMESKVLWLPTGTKASSDMLDTENSVSVMCLYLQRHYYCAIRNKSCTNQ